MPSNFRGKTGGENARLRAPCISLALRARARDYAEKIAAALIVERSHYSCVSPVNRVFFLTSVVRKKLLIVNDLIDYTARLFSDSGTRSVSASSL